MEATAILPRRDSRVVPRLARAALFAGLFAIAGCGEDEEPPPPPRQARPNTPAAPGPGGPRKDLVEKVHIEDRVDCPPPEQPTDPKGGQCDPKSPSCGEQLYCLPLAQGNYCEPCPERDRIRHAFKERDFDLTQNRDPFQSLVLQQLTPRGPGDTPLDPTKKCLSKDQMVATTYSYADLKLVGIVAQGTMRKVLMMGGPLGYIIKRGDCVGREKAVVKEIGASFITFQLDADQTGATPRAPEEYSVQLNPKQLMVEEPEIPTAAPKTTIAPVVPPPATLPPRPNQGQAPAQSPPAQSPTVPTAIELPPAQPAAPAPAAPKAPAPPPVQLQPGTPPKQ